MMKEIRDMINKDIILIGNFVTLMGTNALSETGRTQYEALLNLGHCATFSDTLYDLDLYIERYETTAKVRDLMNGYRMTKIEELIKKASPSA